VNPGAIAAAVGFLALNAFFVAAEFALLAARRSRIEHLVAEGDRRAEQALAGLRELSLMLAAAQLGITMASLGLGAVAEPAIAHGLEGLLHLAHVPEAALHAVAFTIALAITVFLHMVVGEMAPKSWAIADPERSALALARPFRAFALLTRPAIRALNAMANGLVRLCGVEPQDELARVHRPGDLLLLVQESAREGTLGKEHSGLLSRALEVSGLDAEATMIPRRDIVAVPAAATVTEVEQVTSDTGRSRLVVFDGDLDRVVGVLHVKDLLRLDASRREHVTAADLARPAFVTVESRPIEDLMVDMRAARAHLAIVIDEYGSVSGLVALEDLIEELIGDFEDESDPEARMGRGALRRRPDGAVVLSGSLRPDELEDRTGIALPEGDYETVAGFLISVLERVPAEGDRVDVDGRFLEVTRMDGPRVVEVALKRQ
jgi:CBS domain containing-hemolysin-like protein